jgi:hypothetical protein
VLLGAAHDASVVANASENQSRGNRMDIVLPIDGTPLRTDHMPRWSKVTPDAPCRGTCVLPRARRRRLRPTRALTALREDDGGTIQEYAERNPDVMHEARRKVLLDGPA